MAGGSRKGRGSRKGNGPGVKRKVHFDFEGKNESDEKLKSLFNQFVEAVLKEICGASCYRPLPAVIGDGQEVDLFKLHNVVRTKGGYSNLHGKWSSVAKDCGFDMRCGAPLKLVYFNYLHTLDGWLSNVNDRKQKNAEEKEADTCFGRLWMELEPELKAYLSGVTERNREREDDECGSEKLICRQRARLGPYFQADLPDFYGDDYEVDLKWLGTKIWPLDSSEQNKISLIEQDPIGKGRQACGCCLPGSLECVRLHVREKRMKLRLDLGSAFHEWHFDNKGEIVAIFWTNEDEKKFQDIMDSKIFWDELVKSFPEKGREALVSYYFNVFLLRRKIHQNRRT